MNLEGTVVNGVVVLDPGIGLPDGTRVELVVKERPATATALGQRLLKLAGIANGLPSDLAKQHDHYIHGTRHLSPPSPPAH
jgi:hypothetical protein